MEKCNNSLTLYENAKSLVNDMTTEDKISYITYLFSPILFFNTNDNKSWIKYLVNFVDNYNPEIFVQVTKLAATFNTELIHQYFHTLLKLNRLCEKDFDNILNKLILQRVNSCEFDTVEIKGNMNIAVDIDESTNIEDIEKKIIAQSIVLLKNNGVLPLSKEKINKIAFITINDSDDTKLINKTTIMDAFNDVNPNADVMYAKFCVSDNISEEQISKVVSMDGEADIVVLVVDKGVKQGDQIVDIHKIRTEVIEKVCRVDKPIILLNFTDLIGDLTYSLNMYDAVFQCWHSSQHVLEVIAGMIFNDYKPTGKLPVSLYTNIDKPLKTNNSKTLVYPFGYGLNYSNIEYYRIYLSHGKIKAGEDITVTIFLKNKGKYDTKDVVQIYLSDEESSVVQPVWKLVAIKKVLLPVDEEVKVSLTIESKYMALINKNGDKVIESGRFSLYVGGGQPDDTTAELYNRDCLHIGFLVE